MTIEYRVRPVTRYIVTRYEETERCSGCSQHGEFDNPEVAYQVGYALCKAEHDRLGYPPDDMRIIYPGHLEDETAAPSVAATSVRV